LRARPGNTTKFSGAGGVDRGQVDEGLREVADLLPGQRDLLQVEAHVVGLSEHLLEAQP
jgi:hypothetical protein